LGFLALVAPGTEAQLYTGLLLVLCFLFIQVRRASPHAGRVTSALLRHNYSGTHSGCCRASQVIVRPYHMSGDNNLAVAGDAGIAATMLGQLGLRAAKKGDGGADVDAMIALLCVVSLAVVSTVVFNLGRGFLSTRSIAAAHLCEDRSLVRPVRIAKDLKYHAFVSHQWSSGQVRRSCDARRSPLMLPMVWRPVA
jgi:hypothetical protein